MNNDFTRNALSVTCCDEQLLLHPDKVLYWPARKTLLAADIHVGKEQSLARAGIAVPGGISEHTLNTLMQAVDHSNAERLIILGDLLHDTPEKTESWQPHLTDLLQQRTGLTVQVIVGNHDTPAARKNLTATLDWQPTLHEPPFRLMHEPHTETDSYVIAGHIHPVYRLATGRRNRLRAPVFWFRHNYAVLPAFGEFTGGYSINRQTDDRLFMVADQVLEV